MFSLSTVSTNFASTQKKFKKFGKKLRKQRQEQLKKISEKVSYAQVIKFAKGELSESEAKEETKRATRQYARRQETWFSRDERITWIKGSSRQQLLEEIISSTIGQR